MSAQVLHSSSPKGSSTTDWINDLTYSDDENDSIWDLLEKNYSSPETQQLQPSPIEPLSSNNVLEAQAQDALFHPLARGESYLSAISDEGSYLAYSVSSLPGEEERANSYGSCEEVKKPGFRHAPSLVAKKHVQPLPRPDSSPTVSGKSSKSSPSKSSSSNNSSSNSKLPTNNINYRLQSPLPTLIESPLTSTTVDSTLSPFSPTAHLEKDRIESILQQETKARRQKRLRRIKKAAEAREAAVQRVRGTQQTEGGDALWGWGFVVQFLLVSIGALVFAPSVLTDNIPVQDDNPFAGLQSDDIIITGVTSLVPEVEEETISHIDYVNVLQLVTIASGYASLCSLMGLGFMMMMSKNILHVMLIFAVFGGMVCTVVGVALGGWVVTSVGVVALVLSLVYTVVVWERIPFASTNLSVALKGMRSSMDIPLLGVAVLVVLVLWTIWWICSFVGVFDFLSDTEELSDNWMVVVVVFYVFSYYWTVRVIKGISQTTVAGIIGQWWNHDSLPMCSSALRSSFQRNIIQSFGSICLGALVIDPCVLYHRICNFIRLAKPKLSNMASPVPTSQKSKEKEKIKSPFEDNIIYRNVNQWSYSYIGLYGYKFWDSGSKASQLFEARGWTHVVSDDIILTALTMSSIVIGGSTGCLGLIVEEVDGFSFTTLHKPLVTAFLVGLFVGLVLSSIFLSIIEGSVSAILVCYASDPVDFHANHPLLSAELKGVWREFWLSRN